MQKFAACQACGSTSSPQGARFCCDCGTALPPQDDVPFAEAQAVVLDEPTSSVAASTPTGVSSNTSRDYADATAVNDYTNYANGGATYWKNPSEQQLARASNRYLGSILFIDASDMKGHVTVGKTISVGNILAGKVIDLSRAEFVYPTTTIVAGSILGGLKVIVPRGVRVENHGVAILGGTSVPSSAASVSPHQDAPLIIVKGAAILGGVSVRVNEDAPPIRIMQ